MTNLTNVTTTNTNLTNEVIPMEDINKSQLVSTMAAELFHNGLTPVNALRASAAFVGAIDYMDDMEDFTEALIDGLEVTTVEIKDNDVEVSNDGISEALVAAGYMNEDDTMGHRLHEIAALRTEAYAPNLASEGVTRRFGYAPVVYSDLFIEATHALESSEYTVDENMLSIALRVQAVLGADEDDEGYVLKGCQKMDSTESYTSEFKGDRRGRLYQAACHGPNGQASDRSRALMDLAGVPMDYDVKLVKKAIRAEVMDMVTVDTSKVGDLMKAACLDSVQFILNHLAIKEDKDQVTLVAKPWSFVKASLIWKSLQDGNMPYIGMAVGLDAKCSGPQLGALMVGDQKIAAACGMAFTEQELDDAYHIAIAAIEKAGFTGLSRGGIKKSYMGIFYGQGWAAFTDVRQLGKDEQFELIATLYPDGVVNDDTAKRFHRAITSSFGSKMVAVRNMIKEYSKTTQGRTKHFMPDGFEVAMNYKEKVNVLGELMEFDTLTPDVFIRNNTEQHKFINFQLKTKAVHVGDFARNGFVNMIQAVDALIARLIIVHLKRLGAKHIIAVHDCFRVNVTEMHLLEQAIKNAYQDLFGTETNCKTKDMPKGTDILALYFEGANKQLLKGCEPKTASQFMTSGNRRLKKINGVKVSELIQALGKSYYFAK